MKKIVLVVLRFYKRFFSPILVQLFGHGCRFSPTCSEYSAQAIEEYGLGRGIILGLVRLSHCQPFAKL